MLFSFSLPSFQSLCLSRMDPRYPGHGFENVYSHDIPRSRASSGTSTATTETLFHSLHFVDPPTHTTTSPYEPAPYSSSRRTLSQELPASATSGNSRYQSVLDADWFDIERRQPQGSPLLRVSEQLETAASSPPLASIESETMR